MTRPDWTIDPGVLEHVSDHEAWSYNGVNDTWTAMAACLVAAGLPVPVPDASDLIVEAISIIREYAPGHDWLERAEAWEDQLARYRDALDRWGAWMTCPHTGCEHLEAATEGHPDECTEWPESAGGDQ